MMRTPAPRAAMASSRRSPRRVGAEKLERTGTDAIANWRVEGRKSRSDVRHAESPGHEIIGAEVVERHLDVLDARGPQSAACDRIGGGLDSAPQLHRAAQT